MHKKARAVTGAGVMVQEGLAGNAEKFTQLVGN